MLDIQRIRKEPETVKKLLAKKGCVVDFSELLQLDQDRREIISQVEQLKANRNKVSALIPQMKKNKEDVSSVILEMKQVGDEIKKQDEKLADVETKIKAFLDALPNLPADDLLEGGKENNQVILEFGKKPVFDFEPKHHVDLAENLGLIDYTRGAKVSGAGFWIYTNLGAQLEWALLNYFIETHLQDGYQMMLCPNILNYSCGYTAGQFPKFKDDVYWIDQSVEEVDEKSQFILPTAETVLVNLHRDEILNEHHLPKKYFAYSPCYRKEAGSYRAEERGMIRGHQFNKIELFQYTKPEESDAAFEELVKKAARLVEGLELHFVVSKLAAADCSSAMARTNDIEVWIPSMNDYKEVSSASNAHDYQARRGNIRFKRQNNKHTEYVHTLNASGLATSRIFPAILEQHQQKDGSVHIPKVLQKWMGGLTKIEPIRK